MLDLDRRIVISRWLAASDRALTALRKWRKELANHQEGGLVSREELREALALLDQAGLAEWAEWGAGENLDELAEMLTGEELGVDVDDLGDLDEFGEMLADEELGGDYGGA